MVDLSARLTSSMAPRVTSVPPTKPSMLLLGLIQARSGVRPTALPTNRAPTSLATTAMATRHSVSVPSFDRCVALPKCNRAVPNEPMMPTHTMPSVVMAMLGIGLESSPGEAMKLTAQAANASTITNGNVPRP